MSISSSGISSDERWRSSMTTSRRFGREPSRSKRRPPPRLSNPVAMTVTRTSSPSESSTTAPKMMLESPAEALCTISAASLTSNRPRSEPPVMFSSTPVAPSTLVSSSGLEIAVLAASAAGVFPPAGALACAFLPAARADAHECRAGVVHDRPHVREVEVDEPRDRDQVGDALDALAQHVVGGPEGLEDRGAALDDRQQPLVRDDDLGVDHLPEAADALVGLTLTVGTLEGE